MKKLITVSEFTYATKPFLTFARLKTTLTTLLLPTLYQAPQFYISSISLSLPSLSS